MAEVSIRRKHGYADPQALRARIEGLADKVAAKLGGAWQWQGDEAVCQARGAEARVGYDAEDITIEVSLPRPLRPLAGRLESTIDAYYGRYFERD